MYNKGTDVKKMGNTREESYELFSFGFRNVWSTTALPYR